MTRKFKIGKAAFIVAVSVILCSSCTYDTEEKIDKSNKLLPNGKHLVVEKATSSTTATGFFTKYSYGITHSFYYKLSINPGDVNWDGGSAEPKNIIFYKDAAYIHYLKEKDVKVEAFDSLDNITKTYTQLEVHDFYEKHIDERYFFKLFGSDYWTEIPAEEYFLAKQSSEEYDVPNDNELTVITNVSDDLKK